MRTRLIVLAGLAVAFCACSTPDAEWTAPPVLTLGCDDYQSIEVGDGILYNNVWNKGAAGDYDWSQCLVQKPDKSAYGWSWDWPETGRHIYGYPQIKRGTSPWDPLPKIDARFPAKLSEVEHLHVTQKLDVSANGKYNVASSFWLTNTPEIGDTPNNSVITAEIMVWTFTTKGHMNPAGKNIGILSHAGHDWSIWLAENWKDASGENDNKWVIVTFKSERPNLTARFNLATLMGHEKLAHLGLANSYVADVETGMEIMSGAGVAWVERFDVDIKFREP